MPSGDQATSLIPEIETDLRDGVLDGDKGAEIKRATQVLGVDAFVVCFIPRNWCTVGDLY